MAFQQWLQVRLKKDLPGQPAQMLMMPIESQKRFPIPEHARLSSVLLPLIATPDDCSLLLIQRSNDGSVHSGQMAFPGGKIEPFDVNPEAAALREAEEEIHLNQDTVTIVGKLSPLYVPVSHFKIIPVVGFVSQRPNYLKAEQAEVAEILTLSLRKDLPRKLVRSVTTSVKNTRLNVPGYPIDNRHFIWGATAMILSELEALWHEFLAEKTL